METVRKRGCTSMARYALSDSVRRDMPVSGLPLIPRAEMGDILIPPYSGSEDPESALRFLTLWSLWAIQLGFSQDLTKQLLEEYIKKAFSLPTPKVCRSWKDYIDDYYQKHRIPGGVAEFEKWYNERSREILIVWFSYGELERATGRFAERNWLGQGRVGVVYKGVLAGGETVAVKTLKGVKNEHLTNVLNEVCLRRGITRSTHPNVVHLIGFCTNARNPLLVSEYIGANLRHHLEGVYGDHLLNNPQVRLSVAIDVANALVQLHNCGPWPICHRDVRSTNILLNSEFRAKLNDFNVAVAIKSESDRRIPPFLHSQGYMDPVYEHTGVVQEKTDVYSYGVVVMELVTLMKVWDPFRPQKSLADLVITRAKGGHPYSMINPSRTIPPGNREGFHGDGILERMLHVAVWCCDGNLERRPTMADVAEHLQEFQRSGYRRGWAVDSHLVGAQKGRLGWEWDHPSPITSPRNPD